MQIKYDRGASNAIEEASILVFKRVYVMHISLVKQIKTALVSMLWGYKPTHLDSFLIIIKSLKGDEEGRNTKLIRNKSQVLQKDSPNHSHRY